ncbi:MAG: hypothetical protein ACKO01_12830 [Erythrobacter sp.]
MDERSTATPDALRVVEILSVLEQQLAALDTLGVHIAAAHLDAAIQQLRKDIALC